jgi:multidrug resistance protein
MAQVIQGIAPAFVADIADRQGRRPMYIYCFIVFSAANIGLALQNNYTALLVLRMLQSAGSSGTVALANGVVGDIVTSAERGTYIAFASLGGIMGPMVAPIIGGVIGQYAGWHWIFWFLLIFSTAVWVPLILFMPETCRNVVDNGSIPPPFLSRNITDAIRHRHRAQQGLTVNEAKREEMAKKYHFRLPNPLSTLKVLLDLESAIILISTGLGIGCFYAIR